VRIADRPIDGRATVLRVIRENEPGTTLTIKVKRGETELELPATLTHPFGQFLTRIAAQNHMGGKLSLRRTGFPVVLQHDTVLAPEDCGGPLVDLDGAAVGLNIARAGRTESYALPADVVIAAVKTLRSAAVNGPHLANESVPDVPKDGSATSVDSGAQ
jgi:serine protease Do